ncbi:NAD-dependent epimerase/dehydratase family protein [Nocardiopsis sp. CT-R113]|uniref:NAD-dependent epimerase/dehydratase family protein n=1 Tax=Nocardiopsis codii TaxID=3065942 RepID=A0ABU7KDJ1_9ACTN|nr:NAD-dependent epimerase/dehydratase family protein [Nocardiopsis sp. CT-R113]MEE2039974.1 NAD-dependent epimerase/dehydratase family protein [Nocardiopsis sp. CT-R113]
MPSAPHPVAGRRVLVTGGAGFIGSHVVRRLAEAGAEVTVLDSLDAYGFDQAGRFGVGELAEVVRGDVTDAATTGPLVARSDAVVHAAAVADVAACTAEPDRDFSSMRATQAVLEAARRHGTGRVVLASSAQVYGAVPARGGRFHEDDPLGEPGMLYANSKSWAERQGRLYGAQFGVPVTVLRYFSVYGPHQVPKPGSHSWCAAIFSVRALRGLPLVVHGDGAQVRDLVSVADVARATVEAVTAPRAVGRTVNVGTGRATSIAELARTVAELVPGVRVTRGERPAGDPDGGAADTGRLRDLLGFEARTTPAGGLREYLAWARANPDLFGSRP